MSQNKSTSLIESLVNTLTGFVITLLITPIIYKICKIDASFAQMGYSTLLYTLISIIRQYVIRRFFNDENNINKVNNIIKKQKV